MTLTSQNIADLKQGNVERYIHAATRENTRRGYRASVEHYEQHWLGLLPATADQIAQYLADHADTLSYNTLQTRLAGLSAWHKAQGFPNPTTAPLVRKVLKGIRELHPDKAHSARPLRYTELQLAINSIETRLACAYRENDTAKLRTLSRNRALILVGFWRGFRSDELCRMLIESTEADAYEGMRIFLPRSKGDREARGREYATPALKQLCPVDAYLQWLDVSALETGPVFRAIDRWGNISGNALHSTTVSQILRETLHDAGVANATEYSSHSLRHGFAMWAKDNHWDLQTLMDYVQWRDPKSAMRYLEASPPFFGMTYVDPLTISTNLDRIPPATSEPVTKLTVFLRVTGLNKRVRSQSKTRDVIETRCFAHHKMRVTQSGNPAKYELSISHANSAILDEIVTDIIDRAHALARDRRCIVEMRVSDPQSHQYWD